MEEEKYPEYQPMKMGECCWVSTSKMKLEESATPRGVEFKEPQQQGHPTSTRKIKKPHASQVPMTPEIPEDKGVKSRKTSREKGAKNEQESPEDKAVESSEEQSPEDKVVVSHEEQSPEDEEVESSEELAERSEDKVVESSEEKLETPEQVVESSEDKIETSVDMIETPEDMVESPEEKVETSEDMGETPEQVVEKKSASSDTTPRPEPLGGGQEHHKDTKEAEADREGEPDLGQIELSDEEGARQRKIVKGAKNEQARVDGTKATEASDEGGVNEQDRAGGIWLTEPPDEKGEDEQSQARQDDTSEEKEDENGQVKKGCTGSTEVPKEGDVGGQDQEKRAEPPDEKRRGRTRPGGSGSIGKCSGRPGGR